MPYREPIRAIRERPPSPPQRNISQSSTHTASSTSSLEAAPIRPPPIQTRTAATRGDQLPSAEEVQRQEEAIRSYSRERSSREESRSPVTPRPDRYSFGTRRESPKSPRYGYGQSQYHHPAPSHLLPLELRPSASGPDLASLRKEMLREESAVAEDVDLPPSPSKGSSLVAGMDTLLISSKNRARSSSGQPNGHGAGVPNSTSSVGATGGSGRGDVRKAVGLQDFTFGEMIGRGSYSTVVLARQNATNIPYAIKILDQAHLIQQKKTKYAKIERDALVRLAPQIRTNGNRGSTMSIMSNSTVTGHRRRGSGASGSSAGGSGSGTFLGAEAAKAGRRRGSNDTGSWGTASFTERGNAFLRQQATGNGDSSGSPSIPPIPIREGRPDSQITVRNDNSPPLGSDGTSPSDKPDLSRLTIPTSPRMGANSNGMASLSSSQSTITYSPTETIARRSGESERQEVLGKPPVARKRKRASHPGVIKLHYTFKDHTSLYFVLDLAINGELLNLVRKHGSLDLDSARRYSAQVIDTIDFMHERGVIHRDLKPENILLDDDWRIKITDFGSAKVVDPVTLEPVDVGDGLMEGKKRSFVGTAEYVSPEVLRNEHAGMASDIWAFGCILYQLIAGKPPFRGSTEYLTFQKVLACEYTFPEEFDPVAKLLVERILKLDPLDRPTIDSIRNDAFFESINFAHMWTDHMPEIKTGIAAPVKTAQQTVSFTEAFGTAASDGESDDGIYSASSNDEDHLRKDRLPVQESQAAQSTTPMLAFPRQMDTEVPQLREPQRQWIEKGSNTFSSTETVEEAAAKAKARLVDTGKGESGGAPLARKVTHQWEQEERRKLWSEHLREGESIIYQSPILTRAGIFLPKRRTLVLTSAARLLCVKEDAVKGRIKIESECLVTNPLRLTAIDEKSEVENKKARDSSAIRGKVVKNVQAKGPRAFQVQTYDKDHTFLADREDIRARWIAELKSIDV